MFIHYEITHKHLKHKTTLSHDFSLSVVSEKSYGKSEKHVAFDEKTHSP